MVEIELHTKKKKTKKEKGELKNKQKILGTTAQRKEGREKGRKRKNVRKREHREWEENKGIPTSHHYNRI